MKNKKANPSNGKKYPNSSWYVFNYDEITRSRYCVIKSWRSPPKQCPTASSRHPTLVEIDGQCRRCCWSLNLPYKTSASTDCTPASSLLVTGDCTPAFAFHFGHKNTWSSNESWTPGNCDTKEPYDPSQKMRFCQVKELDGRFYAMSLQGSVVVIDSDDDDRFGITRIGGNRAVPSEACRQFREYLVRLNGEMFVVFLMSRKSLRVVDDVEVFRLDTEKLLWVQVGNIGEMAIFLDDDVEDCVEFEGCEERFRRNCIYFTHLWIEEWLVFDMETRLILPYSDVEIENLE